MDSVALLCAGGTGGHMFPAEALAHELVARGWGVRLVTDDRGERFASTFPGPVDHLTFRPPDTTNKLKALAALPGSLMQFASAYREAGRIARGPDVRVAIGFGGYPTLAPVLAAKRAGHATLVHEQNAVLGRANRVLAKRVDAIACGFPLDGAVATGNPVRPAVLDAAETPYPKPREGEPFDLLVFGGSQGARFFGDCVPKAMAAVDETKRGRIRLTLQSREEDDADARRRLADAGVEAEVSPFFPDMAQRIARAHLVVARAGASTVSELAVIGRPAILVPYPHALDHDQAANAAEMVRSGGAEIVAERDLSPEGLAAMLSNLMDEPETLERRAAAMRAVARPDAAARLADLVEKTVGERK